MPARRQIALRLEAGIRDGGYAEGTRLPSVRAMGERLGVHRETVAAAYRELGADAVVLPSAIRPEEIAAIKRASNLRIGAKSTAIS